ncbi:cysteine sulfinic acid decarboxylase isoform X9 [Choloepus didactylus]|uniref:cysteine sulfinic acid decarboxylase isoform X9 n=1 Tax=Choloepus didactylus TaxID=27675 RepID=UPI00189CA824|nr:cysteine sulfinic acid decarboxylase isoform X9 [Choloepus didactylus]
MQPVVCSRNGLLGKEEQPTGAKVTGTAHAATLPTWQALQFAVLGLEKGGGGTLGFLWSVGRPEKLSLHRDAARVAEEESLEAIAGRLGSQQNPDWQCMSGPAHSARSPGPPEGTETLCKGGKQGNEAHGRAFPPSSREALCPPHKPGAEQESAEERARHRCLPHPAAPPPGPSTPWQSRGRRCPRLDRDFILMAESKPLLSLDGDSIAAEALLQDVFEIVVDEVIRKGTSASEKVCEWKEPEELKQLLDLELRSQGESQEQILERCQAVIRYSVKTCHPRFFNQLFSGLDPHSLAGRIITESLNTSQGKMIPEDLERQISLAEAEGAVPFLVSATSGTTVLGAFDPLEAIADICQHHGLWLHVDAAWGGSVLLSQTHRHLLDGIQRADSVAWNPHKLLTAGLQCSALLLRDTSNLLKRCHGSQASYLFQQDKFYDVALDTGDKVVQCGRRVDCLKLWLMWKAQGGQGLEQRVDRAFALARYLVEEMKKREGFELVMEPEFVNVCFWFVPPTLQGKQDSPDYSERLAKVAPVLKERMVKEGSMMIGYQPHGTRGNFFRVVVANPALTRADMDFLLKELERLGQDL